MEKILAQHHLLSEQARRKALSDFHPRVIFPRYVEAMQDALMRPLSVPRIIRSGLAYAEPLYRRLTSVAAGSNRRPRQAAVKKVQTL
jgi:hypothetical protein